MLYDGRFAVAAYHDVGAVPRYLRLGGSMFVPDAIRRCVVFVGINSDGKFHPKATAFLVDSEDGDHFRTHLITAEHVVGRLNQKVTETRKKGKAAEVAVRLNLATGGAKSFSLNDALWWHHPDSLNMTDVAITPFSFARDQFDQVTLPLPNKDASNAAVRAQGGALGQELFILGLFRHHTGQHSNEPIIRVGNLAAMPRERLRTKHAASYIEGFLVEARSISGLSGSPVFLNLRDVRPLDTELSKSALETARKFKSSPDTYFIHQDHDEKDITSALATVRADNVVDLGRYPLLGLMHGHWSIDSLDEDAVVEDIGGKPESVNVGVGIVIPTRKILETLYQEELVAERARLDKEDREEHGATPDIIDDEPCPPSSDANPNHRADFMRLVNVAGRKPEPKD